MSGIGFGAAKAPRICRACPAALRQPGLRVRRQDRLDFLLLNPAAATRLAAAGVDAAYRGHDKASDHAPVWAVLEPARDRVAPG